MENSITIVGTDTGFVSNSEGKLKKCFISSINTKYELHENYCNIINLIQARSKDKLTYNDWVKMENGIVKRINDPKELARLSKKDVYSFIGYITNG